MLVDSLTIATIPLYDNSAKAYKLGGVESYMRALAKAAHERGAKVDAYQISDSEWSRDEGFFTLHGVPLLEEACRGRGWLLPGGVCDTDRGAAVILDEFRAGKLGRKTGIGFYDYRK